MDTHDQLRRLRDKVRELELQNEQLRSRQGPRNGFEIKQNLLSSLNDASSCRSPVDQSILSTYDDVLTSEELNSEDFRDDGTWLYESKTPVNSPPKNILSWLCEDKNRNDYETQRIRRVLLNKIEEIEQGARRNSIDTRTFTRSKKRITGTILGTMTESPIFENSHHLFETPWKKFIAKDIRDDLDDIALKFEDSLPSFSSLTFNASPNKCDRKNLNSTFVSAMTDDRFKVNSLSVLNATFVKEGEHPELRSSDSDLSNGSRKGSNSNLNTTFVVDNTMTPLKASRIGNPKTDLNCTFSVSDVNRSSHGLPCDSADDDQMSSASDSSFSSATRLMNVGDVQNIARLQEESLKQMTSTPVRNASQRGSPLAREEDPLSPINQAVQGGNPGYLSDHSDHMSSRSSVRSSPGGSPFGSNNALANDMSYVVPARKPEAKSPLKQEVRKLETGSRPGGVGRGRPASGLRPPTVRPASGGANRPPAAVGSNIPRPASRIPAPRVRVPLSLLEKPVPKVPSKPSGDDWLDGCY